MSIFQEMFTFFLNKRHLIYKSIGLIFIFLGQSDLGVMEFMKLFFSDRHLISIYIGLLILTLDSNQRPILVYILGWMFVCFGFFGL